MKPSTKEWGKKAEADRVIARSSIRKKTPLYDGVCFHCQQCAEKYLKGLLEEMGLSIPKTHDLDKILNLLRPQHPSLTPLRRGLVFLTTFAVAVRYPGEDATKRQAKAALRWMDDVRLRTGRLLGIRYRSRPAKS